jgi:hypothetical protein
VPDPERAPIVDLAEVFDRASLALAAAGVELDDDDSDPWPAIPD